MTDTQDDCRRAFEAWHDSTFDISAATCLKNVYGYPSSQHVQARWQAWQAAWSTRPSAAGDVSSELLRTIIANDVLIRNMRHRDSRWHDDHDVQKVLDANTAIIQAASNQARHPVTQPNVEELVRRIQLRIENNEDENEGLHGLKGAFESGRSEGLDDAITIIRKWANKGEL